jgi:hypothetical protein
MKNEMHYLRESLAQHRRFIEAMRKRASIYGSDFSWSVEIDCESFLRDLPALRNSTHTVITKAFLKRIIKRAVLNMRKESAIARAAIDAAMKEGAK